MKLVLFRQFGLRSIFLLTVTIFCQFKVSIAQPSLPLGIWQRVTVPTKSFPLDFGFIDSLNGVSFGGWFLSTNNGGKTWNIVDSAPKSVWTPPCVHAIACTAPVRAVIAESNCDQLAFNGDSASQTYCIGEAPSFNNWLTLSMKMYDTSYGFRFVAVTDRRGNSLDTARLVITHDAWNSYESFGGFLHVSGIGGATIVDSNEVWVGVGNTIYRTKDAGITWDTMLPLAGTTYASTEPNLYDFIVKHATHEIYANVGSKPMDYLYSGDDGATWQIDSSFNGRMARMYVIAPHTLWAAIGQKSTGNNASLVNPSYDYWVHDVAYSSDNGMAWSVDSTTFKLDSFIVAMNWFDARHGWVVTNNYNFDTVNPRSFIYYYDPDANAGVETSVVAIKYGTIRVYPNPATNVLYLEDADPDFQLYDPLGRKHPVRMTGNAMDVSALPPGVYYLYDGVAARAKFLKE